MAVPIVVHRAAAQVHMEAPLLAAAVLTVARQAAAPIHIVAHLVVVAVLMLVQQAAVPILIVVHLLAAAAPILVHLVVAPVRTVAPHPEAAAPIVLPPLHPLQHLHMEALVVEIAKPMAPLQQHPFHLMEAHLDQVLARIPTPVHQAAAPVHTTVHHLEVAARIALPPLHPRHHLHMEAQVVEIAKHMVPLQHQSHLPAAHLDQALAQIPTLVHRVVAPVHTAVPHHLARSVGIPIQPLLQLHLLLTVVQVVQALAQVLMVAHLAAALALTAVPLRPAPAAHHLAAAVLIVLHQAAALVHMEAHPLAVAVLTVVHQAAAPVHMAAHPLAAAVLTAARQVVAQVLMEALHQAALVHTLVLQAAAHLVLIAAPLLPIISLFIIHKDSKTSRAELLLRIFRIILVQS